MLTLEQQQNYYDRAQQFLIAGDYKQAEEWLQIVITSASQHQDYPTYTAANITLLRILMNSVRYDELFPVLEGVSPYISRYATDVDEFSYRSTRVIFHYTAGIGTPLEDLEQLYKESKEKHFLPQFYSAGNNLLHVYYEKGDFEKGILLANELETLTDHSKFHDPVIPFVYYVNSFKLYYRTGNFHKAEVNVHAIEAQDLHKKVPTLENHYWFCKALVEAQHGCFKMAYHYFDKALNGMDNKYYFLSELELWIQVLNMKGKTDDVIYYQKIMIKTLRNYVNNEESLRRTKIIEQMTTANLEGRLHTDRLTEVKNRAFYEDKLLKSRLYMNYTVAIFDIDKFKAINDKYGHLIGDQALKFIASHVVKQLPERDMDMIRYGGDEFILLFPYHKDEVHDLIVSLHNSISNEDFIIRETNEKLTIQVSLGIGYTNEEPATLKDLFKIADKALYKAKENGRNQIQVLKFTKHSS
ncbi:GGDEF domain-containing protein [Solibacillus sp. R5-41]|uniref:GGDEF domain-containing protein n=1 Tax=Solibacillus sp. R5-41 TaxID=2048654 RepID=UPI0020A28CD3|nr:GGDEF domain-containing protein [Solibacillus sp. R5-41]